MAACLLLLVVPYAMCAGLSVDTAPRIGRQLPGDKSRPETPLGAEETALESDDGPERVASERPETVGDRTLAGEVTDPSGTPVAGARIALQGSEDVAAISDEQGSFELTLSAGAAVLVASAFGYRDTRTDIGAEELAQDIVLGPADFITGTVLDPEGEPVSGALIRCARREADVGPAGAPARSDALGRFQLGTAVTECDGFATHREFANSARVAFRPGPGNYLALQLQASIKGFVVDRAGVPSRGFVLSLHSFTPADGKSKMRPYRQSFSHPQGRFQVNRMLAGRYVFSVALRGRPSERSQTIAVKSGAQLTNVKIVVP